MFETTENPTENGPKKAGTTFVRNCARCGGYHDVDVFEFEQPPEDWGFWAMCPANQEPILIEELEED